ncbi:MAG: hypothetical protein L3J79_11575, partial [Candidatus Marinimicrobia bacterium]|nr:hypothetical protein [Candidatus Neomarinimicrobiota bacterium]
RLEYFQDGRNSLDRLTARLQLGGAYSFSSIEFTWLLEAFRSQSQTGWMDNADIFEAYVSQHPSVGIALDGGKKVLKWGKGYAWNPVGFVERPKNPNDPDLAREGYIIATADFIRSFTGPLTTIAFTPVIIPVYQGINEDFGATNGLNLAAKLYLLYRDTDIDFMFLTGESRSSRFGMSFSRNISRNFEVHGELAWFPSMEKQFIDDQGKLSVEESDQLSTLFGIRYLTSNETTWIVDLFHNSAGYTEEQMNAFYAYAGTALARSEVSNAVIENVLARSKGYTAFAPMRNYLYVKVSIKEPFDILYLTPSLVSIVNIDDNSFTITPEIIYKGVGNLEIRLRASLLSGSEQSEYGEKKNNWKTEIRLRYAF